MTLKNVVRDHVKGAETVVSLVITVLLMSVSLFVTASAQAQAKSESQQSLDKIMQSLKALDTAYASGNTAEAQSDFDTANNEWKSLSSKISAREGREVQLLFQSLQTKLKNKAPAKDVSRTVRGTLEELREDIRRELNEKGGEGEEGK